MHRQTDTQMTRRAITKNTNNQNTSLGQLALPSLDDFVIVT